MLPEIFVTVLFSFHSDRVSSIRNYWILKSTGWSYHALPRRSATKHELLHILSKSFHSWAMHLCLFVDKCVFPCPMILKPVCGNDGNTYPNECAMRGAACRKGEAIVMVRARKCAEGTYSYNFTKNEVFNSGFLL